MLARARPSGDGSTCFATSGSTSPSRTGVRRWWTGSPGRPRHNGSRSTGSTCASSSGCRVRSRRSPGSVWLCRTQLAHGRLLATVWAVNWWFAFTYNVGDVHVFFIPSHWVVALAAGCGAAWVVAGRAGGCPRLARGTSALSAGSSLAIVLAYPAWRVYDTYPAVDRSEDHDPTRFYDRLTAGMDGNREILGHRPELAAAQRLRVLRAPHATRPGGLQRPRDAALLPDARLEQRRAWPLGRPDGGLGGDGARAVRRAVPRRTGPAAGGADPRASRSRDFRKGRPTCSP